HEPDDPRRTALQADEATRCARRVGELVQDKRSSAGDLPLRSREQVGVYDFACRGPVRRLKELLKRKRVSIELQCHDLHRLPGYDSISRWHAEDRLQHVRKTSSILSMRGRNVASAGYNAARR